MAVSYGFFDGGTEYGQDEFNQYFDAFLRSGVKVEDEVEEEAGAEAGDEAGNSKCYMGLEVTTDGKNNITVGTGTAILQGFWMKNSEPLSLALDRSQGSYARIVVRLDRRAQNLAIVVKYGRDKFPELERGEFVYEISLARAETGSSGGTVGTFTVADERSDVKVCGAIRPRNVLEYDSMVKEQQERWEEWFRWQQGSPEAQREIAIQTSAPKGQVAGRVWIRTY